MPREQLRALSADVDRLLSAGAAAAAGDEALGRRAEALRSLGRQVPALARIAEAAGRVVDAEPARAAGPLLDLLLVVGQARASLATAGVDGEFEPIAPAPGSWASGTAARDLYPVAEALARPGPGRPKALADAVARRAVADLRLFGPLRAALEDADAELADTVAAEALPAFGPAALPDLRLGLDLVRTAVDLRRLTAVASIDPRAGAELGRRALSFADDRRTIETLRRLAEHAPDAAAACALGVLADDPRSPWAREVRLTAIGCLRASRGDEALDVLMAALLDASDADRESTAAALGALGALPHPTATARVLRALEAIAEEAGSLRPVRARSRREREWEQARNLRDPNEVAVERFFRRADRLVEVLGCRGEPMLQARWQKTIADFRRKLLP